MKLTAENVETVFRDCLMREGEDISTGEIIEGLLSSFAFHKHRLEGHKAEIIELLDDLPESFHVGWSFLAACMTKDDIHWGEHMNIEQLVVLGIAIKRVKFLVRRDLWRILPGGMPYFVVTEEVTEMDGDIRCT